MYINLLTNEVIPDENVVAETANGITVFTEGCWRFLPKGHYEKQKGNSVSLTYVSASVSGIVVDGAIPPETVEERAKTYYAHYLGLNQASASHRKFAPASAAVSFPIEVIPGVPVYLRAFFRAAEGTSVEFSFLDGTAEIPVLPLGQETVSHEKRFPGLGTRFPGSNYSYYKDGVETKDGSMDMDGALYTVSYQPEESSYYCVPENSSVRVKVVFRIHDEVAAAPCVEDLMVVQGRNPK